MGSLTHFGPIPGRQTLSPELLHSQRVDLDLNGPRPGVTLELDRSVDRVICREII